MGKDESTIVIRRRERDPRFEREISSVGRGYKKSEIEEKLEFLYKISDKDSVMYKGSDELSDLLSRSLIVRERSLPLRYKGIQGLYLLYRA